jgi:diguanylate cyclase (GGDEF)-like protein
MSRLDTIIRENRMLKHELERLLALAKENEDKHKGFQLVENAFLMSESTHDLDKALGYMEEIFGVRAVLFVDENDYWMLDCKSQTRVFHMPAKTIRYAYVDRRPYFGSYMQGLIKEFQLAGAIGSYVTAPILERGEIIGSLNLYSPDPSRFSADAHDGFIRELTIRVGIALKNLQNMYIISRQTDYDLTTGMYNKVKMYDLLDGAIRRCRAEGASFSFILYDVDNFKYYNDYYGLIIGDEILKAIADALRQELGKDGTVGRFGGDEFYVIFNSISEESIKSLHGRITRELEKNCSALEINPAPRLSGGYVMVPEDIDTENEDAVEIVKKADKGLCRSKSTRKGMYFSKPTGKGEIIRGV